MRAAVAFPSPSAHFTRPSGNQISDAGAKILADAVQSPRCQLRKLNLGCTRGNGLTVDSLWLFKGAFLTSPMLYTTADSKLGDDGAVLLGKALESPNCKLTTLGLRRKSLNRFWKLFRAPALFSVTVYIFSLTHSHLCDIKQRMVSRPKVHARLPRL